MTINLNDKKKSVAKLNLLTHECSLTEKPFDSRVAQIEDLKAAVAAADRGDFANDEEVRATFARHA